MHKIESVGCLIRMCLLHPSITAQTDQRHNIFGILAVSMVNANKVVMHIEMNQIFDIISMRRTAGVQCCTQRVFHFQRIQSQLDFGIQSI